MDDWQLRPSTRQRWVRKIMTVLKKNHPANDEDGLLELRKIAQRLEEKAYSTATSRSGYPRIINSKLKSIEATRVDWQEEVYQKIKTMKEIYLPELNEIHQKIVTKLQQHNSLHQQPVPDQIEKLRMFKSMLERIIAFLQVPKSQIVPNYKEKLGSYEKQIINFVTTTRRRKAMPLQQEPLSPPHMHSAQQPQSQVTQLPAQNNVPIFIRSNSASNSSETPVPVDLNTICIANMRPNQGAEPVIHASGWSAELPPESRQRVVSRIMDTLKRHPLISGEEGLRELQKIAQRFEEKIYTAATSKSDYLHKISLNLLTMDSKSTNPIPSDQASNSSKPLVLVNLNLPPTNNWEPNQGAELAIHASDWRAQMQPESRQRIVTKIMDTLCKHLPVSGIEGLHEMQKIAQRFEEKIYSSATSQSDYLRKISLKLLTMDGKSQNSIANSMPSNSASNSSKTPISGLGMQSQNDGDLTNGRRTSASKRKR